MACVRNWLLPAAWPSVTTRSLPVSGSTLIATKRSVVRRRRRRRLSWASRIHHFDAGAPVKLFYWPRSPYTKKILLAAYEKDFPFHELEKVPPYDAAAMKRLRTMQPLATVPLLLLGEAS